MVCGGESKEKNEWEEKIKKKRKKEATRSNFQTTWELKNKPRVIKHTSLYEDANLQDASPGPSGNEQ